MSMDYKKISEKQSLLESLERVLMQAEEYGNDVPINCLKTAIVCLQSKGNITAKVTENIKTKIVLEVLFEENN